MGYVTEMKAVDDKTFTMTLKAPYGMVLELLGKSGSSIAAIMREKEALTDPQTQVKELIGSGPYIFAKDQWVPGSKAVYLKNKDYQPRTEPPSSFAGGQDSRGRSHRAGVDTGCADLDVGACERRDRLPGEPKHRLPADPGEIQGREAAEDRQDRQHAGHDPPQPPASAVRQRQGAAGDVLPDQPGRLPARHRRRSEILQGLSRAADLRRSATRTTAARSV